MRRGDGGGEVDGVAFATATDDEVGWMLTVTPVVCVLLVAMPGAERSIHDARPTPDGSISVD